MTGDDLAEKVAAVLGEHRIDYERRVYPAFACTCGWDGAQGDNGGPGDGRNDNETAARAHLAAALLPLIREREAAAWERALREAAEDVAALTKAGDLFDEPWDNGYRCAVRDARNDISRRAAANPYAGSEGDDDRA